MAERPLWQLTEQDDNTRLSPEEQREEITRAAAFFMVFVIVLGFGLIAGLLCTPGGVQ
jgi:hypothetical protein